MNKNSNGLPVCFVGSRGGFEVLMGGKNEKNLYDCTDILLNRVISGKEKKYAKACWAELSKETYRPIFEKFDFGKVHNYGCIENTWYGFYFKECPITVSEYFFAYIECNEEIVKIIAK